MRRAFIIVSCAVMCLSLGLAFSYGGEDSKPKPVSLPSVDTWKDPTSGLTWQVSPTGGKMRWQQAQANCQGLSLGGYNDWRLPTITELRSLIRGCPATQKDGACRVGGKCMSINECWSKDTCEACSAQGGPGPGGAYWPPELSGEPGWYWSSSALADLGGHAWGVNFNSGAVKYGYVKPHEGFGSSARCVR
jgi:hypothetical protein